MKRDERSIRVLLIEDNPGDALLVEEYLEEYILRPDLKHVERFQKAKPLITDGNENYDIILLDLTLPDISKEQLIENIKHLAVEYPVVILTGYSDLEFAVKSLSMGVSDYLVKDTISSLVLYKSVLYSIERHRFIRSLRESEKRYMDLFQLSPAPMWVYDPETNAILDVNEAAINHYGYSKEEFLGMTQSALCVKDSNEDAAEKIEALGSASDRTIQSHRKKNGTIINVEIINNYIYFKACKRVIVLATDVTEKLAHLEAIELQNKQLREIAWMQSHVVRAPVSRLMGIIDLMKTGELDMAEKEQMLDFIFSSAEELDEIIRDISAKSEEAFSDLNKEK
ncbi:MAG: PAS domain S-box protein [Balneolaceae bacterium]|nr:PAS domain S-box protein [Balneolaceae bacterium]